MPPKKKTDGQLSLGAVKPVQTSAPSPAPTEPSAPIPVEKLVEYQLDGEAWRCARFDLLVAEMGTAFDPKHLPLFHSLLLGKERLWRIVRRLFGFCPVLPPAHYELEDLRVWEREALRDSLGLTRPQLQQELDALRGTWLTVCPKPEIPSSQSVPSLPPPPAGELDFADEQLLKHYGFKVRLTGVEETAWFAERVRDLETLLKEKLTSTLGRNVLLLELQMRQMDDFLADETRVKLGSKEYRDNFKHRAEMDEQYRQQIDQIKKVAPWFANIAGKHAFKDVLSDLTRAMQRYYGNGDRDLVDGIFTAMEIRVELRRSVQAPDPRYRAGLVVFLNAAKAGFWDPNWRAQFPDSDLKKIDAGWRAAVTESAKEQGEVLVDLEKDGPEGEYPDLKAGEA